MRHPAGALSTRSRVDVPGGAALSWILVLEATGLHLAPSRWGAILVAMSIGVAVSIRSRWSQ